MMPQNIFGWQCQIDKQNNSVSKILHNKPKKRMQTQILWIDMIFNVRHFLKMFYGIHARRYNELTTELNEIYIPLWIVLCKP